jgi:hypothetical protein
MQVYGIWDTERYEGSDLVSAYDDKGIASCAFDAFVQQYKAINPDALYTVSTPNDKERLVSFYHSYGGCPVERMREAAPVMCNQYRNLFGDFESNTLSDVEATRLEKIKGYWTHRISLEVLSIRSETGDEKWRRNMDG